MPHICDICDNDTIQIRMIALCNILNHILFYFQMPGLTKETFLALRQTCRGVTGLAKYLINYCCFKYVLLGKIQSDTIEGRFGQFVT